MATETLDLTVFHSVVKHSSYAKAAEELALSPSAVSRIIARLEQRLGARLLHRTTRKLALTEAGTAFHARTAQILLDLADAEAEVQAAALRPHGQLRLSAPVAFGKLYVTPLVHELARHYAELTVDISLTDRFVDLIAEGMDLALRIGPLTDSRLVARRLCVNHRILVASPGYLKRRGIPRHPRELSGHECVLFTSFARPREWRLVGPDGRLTVHVSGRLASNNAEAAALLAARDGGITVGATAVIESALLSGELVRVLSDWEFEPSSIFAIYASARQLSTKVRAAVDFFAKHFSDPPSWDQRLAGRVSGFQPKMG